MPALLAAALLLTCLPAVAEVQTGPRPGYLIDGLEDGDLKTALQQCEGMPFAKTDFSIAHRGAPLQFPEHTHESYTAANRMGAGIQECDVTFTKDAHLVCRHAECDLHTTTNIVTTELNQHCTVPWGGDPLKPGQPNPDTVRCCASDLTLEQYKSLEGKMDARDPNATTAEAYLGGTADFRTDLYTGRGTVLSLQESIALFEGFGAGHTPELKSGNPERLMEVFGGADAAEAQQRYAQALVDAFVTAGVPSERVWLQSFNLDDVLYWVKNAPDFGKQAVFLDDRYMGQIDPQRGRPSTFKPSMRQLKRMGVEYIAPPLYFLLRVNNRGEIVPSNYAKAAKRAGLKIIAWTFERSDLTNGSRTGVDASGKPTATFYYQFDTNPRAQAVKTDSDMYKALHVLAQDVGIEGIFSDWPGTVTYYANCFDL